MGLDRWRKTQENEARTFYRKVFKVDDLEAEIADLSKQLAEAEEEISSQRTRLIKDAYYEKRRDDHQEFLESEEKRLSKELAALQVNLSNLSVIYETKDKECAFYKKAVNEYEEENKK